MKVVVSLIILAFICEVSCDDALFNSGPSINKIVLLPDFSVIEAQNMFEIELISDTTNKVIISCGENLLSAINISVTDGILYLDHNIKNTWSRKYGKVRLQLYSKPFSRINVRKPVKIFNRDVYKGASFSLVDFEKYCEVDINVDVDYCLIAMSSDNFGQFKVKGRAAQSEIWGWGSCTVRADSLESRQCSVLHRGMGDVYVNATEQLNVSIQFSGNIYYSGEPSQITVQQQSGSGTLIKK